MTGLLLTLSVAFIIIGLMIGSYGGFAYLLGLLVGGVHNLFNVFGYIGASCSFIDSISRYFLLLVFLIGILKVRDKVKT